MLDSPSDQVRIAYLIIRDSVSQFFDEPIQNVGMVNVLQELHEPLLFSKRSELYDNSSQLPAKIDVVQNVHVSLEEGRRNLLKTSLRAFSSPPYSPTGYVRILLSD